MRKIYKKRNIKISLAVSLAIVFIVAILSLLNDYYASTLMPGAVIASYVFIVGHTFLYWKNLDDDNIKVNLKQFLIMITVSGLIINLMGLFIGGVIYNFERCVTVFSVVLIFWLLVLCLNYIFYLTRQKEEENL